MNDTTKMRRLLALTRATISVLVSIGLSIDGCHASDPFFFFATLLWVYQPYVVRTESRLMQRFQAAWPDKN